MVMFAGIDWGGHHHQLAVVARDAETVTNRRFAHDCSGLDELRVDWRLTATES